MNTVEFAVHEGVPYAIDFMNPAPDMDIYSLTPHYFEWALNAITSWSLVGRRKAPGRAINTPGANW